MLLLLEREKEIWLKGTYSGYSGSAHQCNLTRANYSSTSLRSAAAGCGGIFYKLQRRITP